MLLLQFLQGRKSSSNLFRSKLELINKRQSTSNRLLGPCRNFHSRGNPVGSEPQLQLDEFYAKELSSRNKECFLHFRDT